MTRPPTRIDLRVDAYETIASETANNLPRETGGILLGYQENGTIVATNALVVHGKGRPRPGTFATMSAQTRA